MKTKQLGPLLIGWTSAWYAIMAWVRARLFPLWNGLYTGLVEEGLGPRPFKPAASFTDVAVQLTEQSYFADGVKQLGDATHSGEWLTSMWGSLTDGCDCDDFATFIAYTVQKSPALKLYTPSILEVFTEKEGHAVAVVQSALGFHWMDYGKPSRRLDTLEDVVNDVAKQALRGTARYFVMRPPR